MIENAGLLLKAEYFPPNVPDVASGRVQWFSSLSHRAQSFDFVFLDRKFLGTTPVETRDFEPGPHRLNVSAEGYEMYGESVELAAGPNEVVVKFKDVRLDERVDVVGNAALRGAGGER